MLTAVRDLGIIAAIARFNPSLTIRLGGNEYMKTFWDIDTDVRINGGILVTSESFTSRFSSQIVLDKNYLDESEAIRIAPRLLPDRANPVDVFSLIRGNSIAMSIDSNGKIYAPEIEVDRLIYSDTGSVEGDITSSGKIITAHGAILGQDNAGVTEIFGTLKVVKILNGVNVDILSIDPTTSTVAAPNFSGKINNFQVGQNLLTTSEVYFSKINNVTIGQSGILGVNKIGDVTLVSDITGINRTITVKDDISLEHDTHAMTDSDNFKFDQDLRTVDSPSFTSISSTDPQKINSFVGDVRFSGGGVWSRNGNLGIGLAVGAAPQHRLSVNGAISVANRIFVEPGSPNARLVNIESIKLGNGSVLGNMAAPDTNSRLYLNGSLVYVNTRGQIEFGANQIAPIVINGAGSQMVAKLNSDLIDGYHASDIIDGIIESSGSGVISGLRIEPADTSTDKKIKLSSGRALIKGVGIVSPDTGALPTLDGSATNPLWHTVLISTHSYIKNNTSFPAGTVTVETGTATNLPSLSQFRDPIILGHIFVNTSTLSQSNIFPKRTFTKSFIDISRDGTIQFLRSENEGADRSRWTPNPSVKASVEMHPTNGLVVDGNIRASKIATGTGAMIDISERAPKWDSSYDYTHEHFYGVELAFNGSNIYNLTTRIDPQSLVVYKNGLRQVRMPEGMDPEDQGNTRKWDYITDGWTIELSEAPLSDDVIIIDYIVRKN